MVHDRERHRLVRKHDSLVSNSRPGPVDEPAGVVEPLHVNSKADLEWVVLSGKFKVEAGPVNPVPGHPKVADTLVAGSWWAVPRGQPHEVTCLEAGVVFVSYNGSPIMKSLKHAAIDA